MEASQMKFPRPLLGIGKLPHQRNADAREIMQVKNILRNMRLLSVKLKKENVERIQRNDYRSWHV